MDGYLKLLFVQEDTEIGKIIQKATGGQWSHVAVFAFGELVEAVPPRVTISSENRYQDCPTEEVDVYVPDVEAALAELKHLVGKPYGYLDCLSGGLEDMAGISLPLTGESTANCCEVAVRGLRSGGTDPGPDRNSDCWTPQSLYAALKLMIATGA